MKPGSWDEEEPSHYFISDKVTYLILRRQSDLGEGLQVSLGRGDLRRVVRTSQAQGTSRLQGGGSWCLYTDSTSVSSVLCESILDAQVGPAEISRVKKHLLLLEDSDSITRTYIGRFTTT